MTKQQERLTKLTRIKTIENELQYHHDQINRGVRGNAVYHNEQFIKLSDQLYSDYKMRVLVDENDRIIAF